MNHKDIMLKNRMGAVRAACACAAALCVCGCFSYPRDWSTRPPLIRETGQISERAGVDRAVPLATVIGNEPKRDAPTALPHNGDAAPSGSARTFHRQLSGPGEELAFASLLQKKQKLTAERQAIESMLRDKVEQLSGINGMLQSEYGIQPDKNYRYENESMTLYESSSETPGAATPNDRVHAQFKSAQEAQAFMQLVSEKQKTHEQAAGLQSMNAEKIIAVDVCDRELYDWFGVSSNSVYQYDSTSRILYLVGAAGSGAGEAAGSSGGK